MNLFAAPYSAPYSQGLIRRAGMGVYCETSGAWSLLWWCRRPALNCLGTGKHFLRNVLHKIPVFGYISRFLEIVPHRFCCTYTILGTGEHLLWFVPHTLPCERRTISRNGDTVPNSGTARENILYKSPVYAQNSRNIQKSTGNKSAKCFRCTQTCIADRWFCFTTHYVKHFHRSHPAGP